MKILFINNFRHPDYQNDMVFHGLKTISEFKVYESSFAWYMYENSLLLNYEKVLPFGRGFTTSGKLNDSLCNVLTHDDIIYKIKNNFFDKIIYGSITRCKDYIDIVLDHYTYSDIIFINGEDDQNIDFEYVEKGKYFKRELTIDNVLVFPIQFSIPENLIVVGVPEKSKKLATIIPGKKETYIFDNEIDYYNDYKASYYAITHKKGGWDCLRHYEILMNGCFPIFLELEKCPKNTMFKFPKNLILEWKDAKSISIKEYNSIVNELLEYTRIHLTTKKLVNYLINL